MATTPKGKRIALVAGSLLLTLAVSLGIFYRNELWTAYVLWRDFESLGRNDRGYREYRHRRSGVTFVLVPGGTFTMGSSYEAGSRAWEHPEHEVTLSAFLIAKWELTQGQWEAAMNEPSRYPMRGYHSPVTAISWHECREFCSRTGLNLPSEAQWEYACRAGTTTRFWSGDSRADLRRVAWFQGQGRPGPSLGGKKPPNSFGLHDMHGNVSEWCEDRFDRDFYKKPESRGRDPVSTSCTDPSDDRFRTVRGGHFSSHEHECRSASRLRMDAGNRMNGVGFRPVYRLP